MVTLEISSTEIRLIEVNGKKIVRWARKPLEPGIFNEEIVTNPQALGNAISALMASQGIKEKNAIASVSGIYSLSRIVAMPGTTEQPVTEKAVLEATEDVIPVSAEELYLSWKTLSNEAEERQVLVLGVPRDMVDNEIRALKLGGIEPGILDLKTLALARVVNRPDAIVLNIDTASFDIVVLAGNIPDILRTTVWQPDILPVEEKAEKLISAVEITSTYFNSHHPGAPLDPATPLFITGQLSGDTALTDLIRDGLVFPYEPLSPPLEYPREFPVSEYAVNIGLAMKASAMTARLNLNLKMTIGRREQGSNAGAGLHSVPDINLLPQAYQPWRPSAKQVFSTVAIIAVIGMLVPSYDITTKQMRNTDAVRQRYTAFNTELTKRKVELAKREPLQKSIDQYKGIVAIGGGFIDDLEAIKNIAAGLDVQIVLRIVHTGTSISFPCEAPDYITFRQFINALGESGRFTVSAVPPEGYPFIKGGNITLKPIN